MIFEAALKVLDEAASENGEDVLISRARAKVYWRAQDHVRALSILRDIADEVGKNNNVERAFALREAAISAANCDEWDQAEEWFAEAQISASLAELTDMQAMAIGLGADRAVAAFKIGKVEQCLAGLAEGLVALNTIDPKYSLRCANCHHLLRHTVLWLQSRVEGREVMIGDEPILMRPGMCSNPEPAMEIAERPLGSIDFAWYMLAETELASRHAVGIVNGLHDRLSAGPIPMLEISLRSKLLGIDIEDINPTGFAQHLLGYIESMAYLSHHREEAMREFDAANPTREAIPTVSLSEVSSKYGHFVDDAVFAYAISCACLHTPKSLPELGETLDLSFGQGAIGSTIFSRARMGHDKLPPRSFEDVLIDSVMALNARAHHTPRDYCLAGVRFLQQAQHSNFRKIIAPAIAKWQRNSWTRIVESETFRLIRPHKTVRPIESALSLPSNDENFLCSLLLAAADATGVTLPKEVRESFELCISRDQT